MRLLGRHGANLVTAAVVAACGLWHIRTNVLWNMVGLGDLSDFTVYHQIAQGVLNGRSPFENPAWFYPPLMAFLVTPFGLTDYLTARWIWFLLSNTFLLLAGWLLWRGMGGGRIALCSIACVWAFGGAAGESLSLGQIGPLLVLLLALALTQGAATQGIALGAGFALKYIPGVVAIAVILHRSRRAITALVATILIAVLVPLALQSFLLSGARTPAVASYWMGTPAVLSWSIPSALLRILDPPRRGGPLPYNWEYGNVASNLHLSRSQQLISAGAAAAVLAAGVTLLILTCGGRLDEEQLPWAMIGLVSLSLAAAPVCWTHYQILQYPGLALLFAASIRRRDWFATGWTVVFFALLYPLPVAVLTAYYNQYRWTAASPPTLYFWTSVTPLACLGLFALALRQLRAARPVREWQVS